jgi:hypothetical protein
VKIFYPFSLAAYHSLIQGGYVITFLGYLGFEFIDLESETNTVVYSALLACSLIGFNYWIISKAGFEAIRKNFEESSKCRRSTFDFLILVYVALMFIVLHVSRDLNT